MPACEEVPYRRIEGALLCVIRPASREGMSVFDVFLQTLFDTGAVVVERTPVLVLDDVWAPARDVLAEEYERRSLECPGLPPRFNETVAMEGARFLHNGCVCLVNRALDEADVQSCLEMPKTLSGDASTVFSLDLALSRLPDLVRMAEGAAPGDPLVRRLRDVGCDYPLSSAGIQGLELRGDEKALLEHTVMRRLYADRIIERRANRPTGQPRCPGRRPGVPGHLHRPLARRGPASGDQQRENRR